MKKLIAIGEALIDFRTWRRLSRMSAERRATSAARLPAWAEPVR